MNLMRFLLLSMLWCAGVTALAGCDRPADNSPADPAYTSSLSQSSDDAAKSDDAKADHEAPADSDASNQDGHGDEGCTEDCSGHNAGYRWARDNEITDEAECAANSQSFIEGCEAYVQDREDEDHSDHE